MKIVMVSGHSCIRVHKIALPLIDMGHEVHLIARKKVGFNSFYKTWACYEDVAQCLASIDLHSDADIFHCHNEPSWFVCAVKERFPNKPVVLDVHDTYLTRSTPEENDKALSEGKPHVRITTEERNAFQLADALVFVSLPVQDVVCNEFRLQQPSIVLPSYVPGQFYQYHTKEWLGGLVYEGRTTMPSEHKGLSANTGADYCDYLELAAQAKALNMDFHLYAGRDDEKFRSTYQDAIVHPGYDYRTLLSQISRHDWGLVGNTIDSPQWQQTLPNKLYDYVAAGVPVVCINAAASSRICELTGIGITVSSIEELASRWSEHRKVREKLWKIRRPELTMERNIGRLIQLYQEVMS